MNRPPSLTIRRLGLDDIAAAALVHRAAFDERLPWLAGLHAPDEDRWFYRERVFRSCAIEGAFEGTSLLGLIAFRDGWIDQFYVLPRAQGQGVGSALLEIARTGALEFHLWTFQRNTAARRFYARRGFTEVRTTDGAANEEREPDVLCRWNAGPRL